MGQKVKGRVIGARPLDGLSVLSLKPTVVEQQVASIEEVKPGSLMTGTISSIADYGMLVALAPGIRYICFLLSSHCCLHNEWDHANYGMPVALAHGLKCPCFQLHTV